MGRHLLAFTAAGLIGIAASPAVGGPVNDGEDQEAATVAVQAVAIEPFGIRDEVMMVLVGSALIALAAAVRRAA